MTKLFPFLFSPWQPKPFFLEDIFSKLISVYPRLSWYVSRPQESTAQCLEIFKSRIGWDSIFEYFLVRKNATFPTFFSPLCLPTAMRAFFVIQLVRVAQCLKIDTKDLAKRIPIFRQSKNEQTKWVCPTFALTFRFCHIALWETIPFHFAWPKEKERKEA